MVEVRWLADDIVQFRYGDVLRTVRLPVHLTTLPRPLLRIAVLWLTNQVNMLLNHA